jgi:hypothetical protein
MAVGKLGTSLEGEIVTTGQVLGPPAAESPSRYNVRIEGSDIEIEA